MAKKPKYTHYRIDFINCGLDYDYTIVNNLSDILDYMQAVEDDFDSDTDAQAIITPVQMTDRQYGNFIKSIEY